MWKGIFLKTTTNKVIEHHTEPAIGNLYRKSEEILSNYTLK